MIAAIYARKSTDQRGESLDVPPDDRGAVMAEPKIETVRRKRHGRQRRG